MDFAKLYFLSKTALIDANKDVSNDIIDSIWDKFNSISLTVFAIMFIFSLLAGVYYYTLYNNQPGRHYTPYKWGLIYGVQVLIVLIVTIGVIYGLHPGWNYKKVLGYEIQIALLNTVYALAPYFVLSWIWCQFDLPTNAYRLLKL